MDLPPVGITYFRKRQNNQRLVLYGISPSVSPKPADWDEKIKVTGYWFLENENEWSPPVELMEFLSHGKPPVYIGFGSMTTHHPKFLTAVVLKALELSNQRGSC
ncbi:MAG: hypothetical protein HY693_01995 [Deltaproteobacteria bacterium]|nr:hypothetical protein [Deltaproteobacteria bacterium]